MLTTAGYNTTLSLQTHNESIPAQPSFGFALSHFPVTLPMPHFSRPKPPSDDPDDPDEAVGLFRRQPTDLAPMAQGLSGQDDAVDFRRGDVTATAFPLHVGRSTIVVQSDLRDDDDRRVAMVTQTQAVVLPR